jgi:hypothetical protein
MAFPAILRAAIAMPSATTQRRPTIVLLCDSLRLLHHPSTETDLSELLQQEQVQRQAERYDKAQILLEATSVGDPILQALKAAEDCGFKFTNQSNREMINGFCA